MFQGFRTASRGFFAEGPVRLDIELFLLGISISFIPLLLTIWAATNYTTFFNIEFMKYRHELVYGGGSALLLVLFEHYRGFGSNVECAARALDFIEVEKSIGEFEKCIQAA